MNEKPHDHLPDVLFRRVRPAPALRPFVAWHWYIQSQGQVAILRGEFMHPDGRAGLVFNWGDRLPWNGGAYERGVVLDGVGTRSRQLSVTGCIHAFGILFHPGGAFPFFGVPMPNLSDFASNPDNASELAALCETLYLAPSFAERVRQADAWLLRRLRRARPLARVIRPTLDLITCADGLLSIGDIADTVSLSTRQLERLYRTQVGLSPKAYARLMRVRSARTMLKAGGAQTAVAIALDAGYYDQSHFTREFKSVVGLTPGSYMARHLNEARLVDPATIT